MNTKQPCLINQDACGRQAGNPVCPKCGIDDRVVYPGQGDLEVALANARTRYLESHVRLLEQEILAARKALETVVNAESQKQVELGEEKKARVNAKTVNSETLISLQSLQNNPQARDSLCEKLTHDLSSVSGELTAVRDRAMSVNYRRFKLEVLGFDLLMTLIGVPLFFVLFRKFNWNAILEVGGGGVIASIWFLFLCLSGLLQFIVDFRKFKNGWHDPFLCYQDLAAEKQKNKLSKYSATYRFLSACEGIANGVTKAHRTDS